MPKAKPTDPLQYLDKVPKGEPPIPNDKKKLATLLGLGAPPAARAPAKKPKK